MASFLDTVFRCLWGIPMVVLLLGTGTYLTVLCGFPQIRFFREALCRFCGSFQVRNGTSPFQALCTALAATIGTGNLIGVAGAICIGGPGTVFWMWICGFFGMATKYAEAVLAVRYQSCLNGEWIGGTMYMIRNGLNRRFRLLAVLYSVFGLTACFGVGNMIQINAIIIAAERIIGKASFEIHFWMGVGLAILIGAVFLGGSERIGAFVQMLVPVASGLYLLLAIICLVVHRRAIPSALYAILTGAFQPKAITGGAIGSVYTVVSVGCSRGVFSNEAGLGTASMAHGSACVQHPVQQGMMGILEVFLDTIVICTLTALVILTGCEDIPYGIDQGAMLTERAFGELGSVLVMGCLCCFAFATVLGWGLYGIRCGQFLFKVTSWFPYCAMSAAVVGSCVNPQIIWRIAEILNGLMAFPNLIALVLLSPELRYLTIQYKRQRISAV